MRTLPLPDLLRGLILQKGWSTTAAAHAAGISPVAAQRFTSGITRATTIWLRLIATFRAEVRILRGEDAWTIQVPTVAQQVRERERRSWRRRRFLHYLHAIAAQSPRIKRSERETRARSYVANEEARIVSGIDEVRRRMGTILLAGEVDGMRVAIQALVRSSHITVDELSFASGVGMDAASKAIATADDGRLRPVRSLLAALDARVELLLPTGSRVVIARLPVDPETSGVSGGKSANGASSDRSSRTTAARRRPEPVDHDGSAVRSTLDRDAILRLYDAGIPITQIAAQAGISRQRVHAIAKSSGRILRRMAASAQRVRESDALLT